MKKLFLLTLLSGIVAMISCGKKDTGSSAPKSDPPVVNLSKPNIIANNFDTCIITVKDKNGNDVTAQASITVNGLALPFAEPKFTTETAGTLEVKATVGGVTSSAAIINAASPGTSRHSQKVLVEQYTGTWCGWCPRVGKAIKDAQALSTNVIGVAVHNGAPFGYPLEAQMRSKWAVNTFPTAVINRKSKWTDNTANSLPQSEVISQTQKWAPLGLAIESAVNGTTISGKVKTQFNVTTSIPLTVTIMLIENGRVAAQRNFYSNHASFTSSPFYSLPDPITDYVHDNILRAASTNIFGDAIPTSATVKDNIYEKNFSFNAVGFNMNNLEVVAIVSYADGTVGRVGVLNAQKVAAGQNIGFN